MTASKRRWLTSAQAVVAMSLLLSGCAWIERVSTNAAGGPGNGPSTDISLGADGRLAVFTSSASNLVASDTNGVADIFVRDNASKVVERVSVSTTGLQANSGSATPRMSSDGRYVAFTSSATNLAPGDLDGVQDVFIRDRQTNTTVNASANTASPARAPDISASGRYVVYEHGTLSPINLEFPETTRYDVQTGLSEFVGGGFNGNNGGGALEPSISDDARFVSFTTVRAAGGPTGFVVPSVAVRDMNTGGGTVVIADPASQSSISGNGAWVAYVVDLLDGSPTQVFVENRVSLQPQQVSVSSTNASGNGSSGQPALSVNGQYVAFTSKATNLVGDDTNGVNQIYVRDRSANRTVLVSRSAAGAVGQGGSASPSFEGDGGYVAFDSTAANFVDGDASGTADVFIRAFPEPTVTSITPGSVPAGTTTSVVIKGTNFRVPSSVGIAGSTVVWFGPATVVSPTTIEVTITVPAGAPLGSRTVVASNLGTGPGPASLAAGACTCLVVS